LGPFKKGGGEGANSGGYPIYRVSTLPPFFFGGPSGDRGGWGVLPKKFSPLFVIPTKGGPTGLVGARPNTKTLGWDTGRVAAAEIKKSGVSY